MSSAAARASRTPARGLSLPGRGLGRPALPPRLRVVVAPAHTRSRAGLVIVCATLLVAAMVGLLLLNVTLEQGAYELRQQQKAATKLVETRDALAEQLRSKSAPDALARQADKLGMVPGSGAAFLKVGDPTVIGQAAAAKAAPTPAAVTAAPGPGATASPAPSSPGTSTPTGAPAAGRTTAGTTPAGKTTAGKTTAGKTTAGKTTAGKATAGRPTAAGTAATKVRPTPQPSGAAR